jgi:hypothetical protein
MVRQTNKLNKLTTWSRTTWRTTVHQQMPCNTQSDTPLGNNILFDA